MKKNRLASTWHNTTNAATTCKTNVLQVVAAFVVLCQVEANRFFFIGHTQTHDGVQDLEDDEGDDRGVDHREAHAFGLNPDLCGDVGDGAEATQGRCSEHTGQDRAEDTADTVHAEGVQGVVI